MARHEVEEAERLESNRIRSEEEHRAWEERRERCREKLYQGMVNGENAKPQDLEVNPLKSKQLTNFRASGKDEGIRLTPPRVMTLEQAIAYIDDDEMVEVTPSTIRLRKAILDPHERKRAKRSAGA